MGHKRFAGIAAILCLTCSQVAGQQLNFESLPGVTADPGPALSFEDETPGDKTECTTAFEVVGRNGQHAAHGASTRHGNGAVQVLEALPTEQLLVD